MLVSVESLLVIVLVLTPGFLFTAALRKTITNFDSSATHFVVMTVATGALIHCTTYFWSARLLRIYVEDPMMLLDQTGEVFAWGLITIFVIPLTLGLGLGYIIRFEFVDRGLGWAGFSHVHRIPSAWDYILELNEGFYVRVHLKDSNRVIGGVYGTNSFAADERNSTDLYLEELWIMDGEGEFVEPIATTRGIWISRDTASFIEFLSGQETDHGANSRSQDSAETPRPRT